MLETMRWFGPDDPVPLEHIRQAGAAGIVTALHGHYRGEVWPADAIAERAAHLAAAGLPWRVVESIPVPGAIKAGGPGAAAATADFAETLRRVAAAGVRTVVYNFMPAVDWTRTTKAHRVASGGLAMRFDMADFAAFDAFVLERPGALTDYDAGLLERARARRAAMSEAECAALEETVIAGLPGAEYSGGRAEFMERLAPFAEISPEAMRANLVAFLKAVMPVAREAGVRLAIHPDDPPLRLFGLPRVVGCAEDFAALADAVPEIENGITLCTGSLGAGPGNDVAGIARRFAERIHFAHLRNVVREADGSFTESDHLDGDVDMVEVVDLLLGEEARRRRAGRADHEIPMRPDHGHRLLDDLAKETAPGYPAIGRLKGLAELRGVMAALARGRRD